MKINIALLFTALLVLSACASTQESKTAEETPAPVAAQEKPADSAQVGAVSAADLAVTEQAQTASQLQGKSVYFDFDQFNVKPEYRDIVQQQADLARAGSNIVIVEGNADERGSSEYNLALGNKRAYAVRKMLELLGVQGSRIEVVSFGEEKPRATCHEEKCWSENRRVDFNVKPGKP